MKMLAFTLLCLVAIAWGDGSYRPSYDYEPSYDYKPSYGYKHDYKPSYGNKPDYKPAEAPKIVPIPIPIPIPLKKKNPVRLAIQVSNIQDDKKKTGSGTRTGAGTTGPATPAGPGLLNPIRKLIGPQARPTFTGNFLEKKHPKPLPIPIPIPLPIPKPHPIAAPSYGEYQNFGHPDFLKSAADLAGFAGLMRPLMSLF